MKTFCISILAFLISLMPTAQALAHHSSAAFDVREEVTVSGTILEYSSLVSGTRCDSRRQLIDEQ